METLRALNREQGVTIIIVTHEPDIAAYADRMVTMRDGQILSDERKPAETPPPDARPPTVDARRVPPRSGSSVASVTGFWAFGSMIPAAAAQALGATRCARR